VLDESAYWCHLANAIKPSMCGGSVAFLSDYFDHLLYLQGGPESVHFSVHHIYGTIQDKMT